MSKLLVHTHHAKTIVQNNDNIFLPTESSYILAHQNHQYLKQRSQLHTQPVFLFSNVDAVTKYTTQLSWQASLLLGILPPGNVEFILPHNQDFLQVPNFHAFIPNHPQTLELLSQFDHPLAGVYPQIGLNALITHHKHILEHPEYNDTFTLVSQTALDGILPTLIDLCDPTKIVIRRPGAVSIREINSILQNRIPVQKDYLPIQPFRDDWLKIHLVNSLPAEAGNSINIVCGSKEILSYMFRIPLGEYFHHKKVGNFILKNIGSHTSQETVARNITRQALDLYKLGVQNVYIMEESWGNNKWSEIIDYYLEGIAISIKQNQQQEVKIPVRVRPVLTSQDFVLG
jgi:tRNA A37 threonylcarbamoyladenosine synthetase subunit TsaC/SUA5/YrdC